MDIALKHLPGNRDFKYVQYDIMLNIKLNIHISQTTIFQLS